MTNVLGAKKVKQEGFLSEWRIQRRPVQIVGKVTPPNAALTIRSGHGDPPARMGPKAAVPVQGGNFSVAVTPTGKVMQYELTTGTWTATVTLREPGYNPAAPVSAHAKAKVAAILSASVAHYAKLLRQGMTILGNTPYPDATAGLAAMNDPKSAAARFRDYRKHPGPETDTSSEDAFGRADRFFTADNEPKAMTTWREDMLQAQSDLSIWVNVAVDWQIRSKSTAQLRAAENKVLHDLQSARRDIAAIRR